MNHEKTHIKVYPTKATAVGMAHPGAHKLVMEGTLWPRDSFTARRLTDGSVTDDEGRAFKPASEPTMAVDAKAAPASEAD